VSGRGPGSAVGVSRGPAAAHRLRHRHTLVHLDVHETEFHVHDQAGELLTAIPRTSRKEITRTNGYGVRDRVG
jgi:hypothetical protein